MISRTKHQADRLIDLLRSYGVPARVLEDVSLGELRDGFVLWSEGVAYVTEEEIFGSRVRQRRAKRQTRRQQQRFLEDLRELSPDDPKLHDAMNELSAKYTLKAGKYGQEGDFTKGVADLERQQELMQSDSLVKERG